MLVFSHWIKVSLVCSYWWKFPKSHRICGQRAWTVCTFLETNPALIYIEINECYRRHYRHQPKLLHFLEWMAAWMPGSKSCACAKNRKGLCVCVSNTCCPKSFSSIVTSFCRTLSHLIKNQVRKSRRSKHHRITISSKLVLLLWRRGAGIFMTWHPM